MKKVILAAVMAFMVSPVLADLEWDAYWSINEATAQADARIIFENSGTGNAFGLFDKANIANKLPVFLGSDDAGDQAVVTILNNVPGSVSFRSIDLDAFTVVGFATFAENAFGYYMTTPGGTTFYSDTLLNPDQFDHMTAGVLQAGSEYQLRWEYQYSSNIIYDNFVVSVESVHPIPEPATLLLLTIGGLILRRRK